MSEPTFIFFLKIQDGTFTFAPSGNSWKIRLWTSVPQERTIQKWKRSFLAWDLRRMTPWRRGQRAKSQTKGSLCRGSWQDLGRFQWSTNIKTLYKAIYFHEKFFLWSCFCSSENLTQEFIYARKALCHVPWLDFLKLGLFKSHPTSFCLFIIYNAVKIFK